MSCIELDRKHYQYIADQLYRIMWDYKDTTHFWESKKLLLGADCRDTENKINWFITMLQCWNSRAYLERYPELKRDDRPNYIQRVNIAPDFDPYGLVKALQSVRYQCADVADWDQSFEKSQIDDLIREIMTFIVMDHAQYIRAQWAIE